MYSGADWAVVALGALEMPTFAYEGRSADGSAKKGKIDADDLNAAKVRLRTMRIQVSEVKKSGALDLELKLPDWKILKP